MLVAGVDGGATSTKALVLDTRSWSTAIGRAGPSNPVNIGPYRAGLNIRRAVEAAASKLGAGIDDVAIVFAGLAGLDSRLVRAEVEQPIRIHSGLGERLVLDHDAYIALIAATGGRPGVLVIAGTGSIVMGYSRGERIVMGDRGWLLGDEGSGFWVARLALRRLRRVLDGLAPRDCLSSHLASVLGIRNSDELMYWFYKHGSIEEIASIARHVVGVEERCPEARTLLARGARLLATMAARTASRIGVGEVYTTGSMFKSRVFREEFHQLLQRVGVDIVAKKLYPVLGAVYEALRLSGYHEPRRVLQDPVLLRTAEELYT